MTHYRQTTGVNSRKDRLQTGALAGGDITGSFDSVPNDIRGGFTSRATITNNTDEIKTVDIRLVLNIFGGGKDDITTFTARSLSPGSRTFEFNVIEEEMDLGGSGSGELSVIVEETFGSDATTVAQSSVDISETKTSGEPNISLKDFEVIESSDSGVEGELVFENSGSGTGSVTGEISVNDFSAGQVNITLGPDDTAREKVTVTGTTGVSNVTISVEGFSKEFDVDVSGPGDVGGDTGPDIVVTNVSHSQIPSGPGADGVVSITVDNQSSAGGSTLIPISINGDIVTRADVSLPGNGRETFEYEYAAPSSTEVTVGAGSESDTAQLPDDTDSGSSGGDGTGGTGESANIVVTDVSHREVPPSPNAKGVVTVSIENKSDAGGSGSIPVSLNGEDAGTLNTRFMGGGATGSVAFEYLAPESDSVTVSAGGKKDTVNISSDGDTGDGPGDGEETTTGGRSGWEVNGIPAPATVEPNSEVEIDVRAVCVESDCSPTTVSLVAGGKKVGEKEIGTGFGSETTTKTFSFKVGGSEGEIPLVAKVDDTTFNSAIFVDSDGDVEGPDDGGDVSDPQEETDTGIDFGGEDGSDDDGSGIDFGGNDGSDGGGSDDGDSSIDFGDGSGDDGGSGDGESDVDLPVIGTGPDGDGGGGDGKKAAVIAGVAALGGAALIFMGDNKDNG